MTGLQFLGRYRRAVAALALAALAGDVALAVNPRTPLVPEVKILALDAKRQTVRIRRAAEHALLAGVRLVLTREGRDPRWCELAELTQGEASFRFPQSFRASSADQLRGYLVPSELTRELLSRWPVGAEYVATIDAVSPAARGAWIDAGADQGVRVGQRWWRRVHGQPVAVLEVISVASDLSFAKVRPLAEGVRVRTGDQVQLWPSPGELRSGRCRSAVALVERSDESTRVWIAAPRDVACAADAGVEFHRDGAYVGFGTVERRADDFWHVQLVQESEELGVRVGDEVRVRTEADARSARFDARVFARNPNGWLITAGEADGIRSGQTAVAYRADVELGPVQVVRAQRGYSRVRPLKRESEISRDELMLFDRIRFTPAPTPAAVVGVIESVSDATLFIAKLSSVDASSDTLLIVQDAEGPHGVALLISSSDGNAIGLVLDSSVTRPIHAGDELIWSETQPRATP